MGRASLLTVTRHPDGLDAIHIAKTRPALIQSLAK